MKTKEELKKELTTHEKIVVQIKSELERVEEKIKLRKLAEDYFNKKFKLDFISDNYNIYPEEYYRQIENRFVENFIENNEDNNESVIKICRKEYIDLLKSDIETLNEILQKIKKQYEELK